MFEELERDEKVFIMGEEVPRGRAMERSRGTQLGDAFC